MLKPGRKTGHRKSQRRGQTTEQSTGRAVKFTPFPGEDVGRLIRDAGAELFMFSSDYPHPEGTDDPIGRFERTFKDISEEAKTKFYSENFQVMMAAAP